MSVNLHSFATERGIVQVQRLLLHTLSEQSELTPDKLVGVSYRQYRMRTCSIIGYQCHQWHHDDLCIWHRIYMIIQAIAQAKLM